MNIFPLRTGHYRTLAVVWTLAVAVACVVPTGVVPAVESYVGLDKAAHFLLFFGLSILWLRALRPADGLFAIDEGDGRDRRLTNLRARCFWLFMLGTAFAMVTEIAQHLLPVNRLFDPYDMVADMVGLTAGIVIYYQQRLRSWQLDDADAIGEEDLEIENDAGFEDEADAVEYQHQPRYHADVQNSGQEAPEAETPEAVEGDDAVELAAKKEIVSKKRARTGSEADPEDPAETEAEPARTEA